MQQIQWQDRFNIGVEIVDHAHRSLFFIVQKILDLYLERHENRFACVEGIKYFKAYALKHFAEEEAYMREIGYEGYQAHKRLHDRMRRETLPALERELYASDFSVEAVQRFIGVCTGWLTGHIMIEDRAITGRVAVEIPSVQPEDELSVIRGVILRPLGELFGPGIQYIGKFCDGDMLVDAEYHEQVYRVRPGLKLRIILIIGEPLLLRAAGLMLGIEFCGEREIIRFALQEITQSLLQRAAACFGGGQDGCRLERDRFLEPEDYVQAFGAYDHQYSLLFGVKRDCFALCIDQISETDG